MEVRVRERLIGALVLVAIVVLFVPAILKGRDPAPPALPESAPTRRVEVPIGNSVPAPEEQILVPEPAQPDAAPAAPPLPPPDPKPRARDRVPTGQRSGAAPRPGALRVADPRPRRVAAQRRRGPSSSALSRAAEKAEQLVAELRKRRYAAFVLEYRASGQVLYRVRVGPEQDRAARRRDRRAAREGRIPAGRRPAPLIG